MRSKTPDSLQQAQSLIKAESVSAIDPRRAGHRHCTAGAGAEGIDQSDAESTAMSAEKQTDWTQVELSAWITPDLVKETLRTWQPYYNEKLSEQDAIDILQSFGRLVDVLQ